MHTPPKLTQLLLLHGNNIFLLPLSTKDLVLLCVLYQHYREWVAAHKNNHMNHKRKKEKKNMGTIKYTVHVFDTNTMTMTFRGIYLILFFLVFLLYCPVIVLFWDNFFVCCFRAGYFFLSRFKRWGSIEIMRGYFRNNIHYIFFWSFEMDDGYRITISNIHI